MAGSAIIGGASLISAKKGSKAAKQAAGAQQAAADAATEESRRQFDTVQENTAVQRTAGDAAMFRLANLLGIDLPAGMTSPTGANAGPAQTPQQALEATPGYTFRLGESQKAIDRMQSAGRITGGRALKEGVRYAQDYGSGEFQNILNNLFRVGGYGSQATGTAAGAGMTSAGQVGQAQLTAGAGTANAAYQGGQAVNNAIQGGAQNYFTLKTYNDYQNQISPYRLSSNQISPGFAAGAGAGGSFYG